MDKMNSFRQSLKSLSNAAYCSFSPAHPSVSLDRDHYQVSAYLPEESFSSRFACTQAAESRLHEYYAETCSQFTAFSDPLSPDGFLMRFKEYFMSRLAELKEQLKPENAAEIDAVLNILVPDEVFQRVDEICEALGRRYTLPPESVYQRLISYEKYDPAEYENSPAAKLVAMLFVRHGFDLLHAIHRLEADATSILCQYKNAFDAQAALEIERSIIHPALSELRNFDHRGS